MRFESKNGISSFLIKGFYLILILVAITLVTRQIFSVNYLRSQEKRNLELYDKAVSIMETLAASENCLGYEEIASVEGNVKKLAKHRVLDKKKLDEFQSLYSDVEPNCARDFRYGYTVDVETLTTFSDDIHRWRFGTKEFSKKNALRRQNSISLPVVIRFNPSLFIPGTMRITVTDGELEELSGAIDLSCASGKDISRRIFFHYPVTYSDVDKQICLNYPDKSTVCRKLSCQKSVEFSGVRSPGSYLITLNHHEGVLRVW